MNRSRRLVAARTPRRARRNRGLREASQRALGAGSTEAKPDLRAGGLAPGRRDPLRQVPLREPYGGVRGAEPEQVGTPETVTGKKPRRKRRRK